MSKNYKLILPLILAAIIGISACSNDTGPRNAQFLTLSELRVTPGFEWFDQEYNNYQPDTNIINQIKAKLLTGGNDEFILYVNPSCACTGTQKQFPASIKILHESGIDEPRFKIYSMYSEGDNHPDMTRFRVNDLPTFFNRRDSIPVYSIMDSLTFYSINQPQNDWTIEEFVFRAL